ncbi:unnamed protein product [Arctia plantaginis]|uniref:Replication factor C subunit 1 n=1 Tax=Arctia plantaginis TaxID=874455 RepID=A0A8S1AJ28_ARCPL|nr:unnamed protein product [Arctia plantaginis]
MSKDIRSYFQRKKVPQSEVQKDDDVIPESPDVQIKKKKKESKKRRVIDDSDEELFSTKKKKDDNKSSKSKPTKPSLKEVTPIDLFGNGPIKRTEPLVKKKKETELGIHSDEELEKSLLEIDNDELELQVKVSHVPGGTPKATTEIKKEDLVPEKSGKESSDKKADNLSTSKSSSTSEVTKEKNDSCDDQKTSKIDKKSKIDNSKRKFSEFIDNDVTPVEGSAKKTKINEESKDKSTRSNNLDQNESKNKKEKKQDHNLSYSAATDVTDNKHNSSKHKLNKSLNDSVLTDEERHERKIASAALYKSYLNRSGPKHLGAKEIPEGTPNCLKDCAFLLTGVLDSFEKDEIAAAINKYGGCVKSAVTKKVTHVLAGDDAGPAKMAKAKELGIQIITEDDFLKMIINRSKKGTDKEEIKIEKKHSSKGKDKSSPKEKNKRSHVESKSKKSPTDKHKLESKPKTVKDSTSNNKFEVNDSKGRDKSKSPKKPNVESKSESKLEMKSNVQENPKASMSNGNKMEIPANASMWVDKYKPQNVKQIIGQHGDASNVKKLSNWLTKWYVNRKAKLPKPSPWAKNDDGGYYKAALLSGPPGVGKTTTVSLVCKELGFDMVEFNASDTRNKTLIKEQIGELLTTNSLSGFAKGETGKQAVSKKHVLVMDEVDGMAGNEDRGGLQELISLIKSASVPIICMCNDRNSQKMRSLVNYCYDLRFSRPRVDQIKSAMMSICFKEDIKLPSDVLSQLIVSANQDVRQTLNLLSMWAVDPTRTDADRLRKDAQTTKKDVKLGPWEAIRKVFSAEDHKTMSIMDKSDLFFYDYSLAPLFVQENYLQVAMYASVIPGHELSGHMSGQIQFPGWLGKNSRATKMRRLCQEIHAHTRLSTSGSKSSIFLDYASHIRDAIVKPLINDKADGISQSLEVLESYHLLREDLESLVELSVWPGQRNPTVLIDSKVKAAMTRTYNKKASALPYAPGPVKRARLTHGAEDDGEGGDDDLDDDELPDSDPENDALIKKKKTKDADKPGPSKEKNVAKPSTSKKKKET